MVKAPANFSKFRFHMSLYCRKSVSSFFAAFDALCEEGTATSVCKALDEIADVSAPGMLLNLAWLILASCLLALLVNVFYLEKWDLIENLFDNMWILERCKHTYSLWKCVTKSIYESS